MDQFDEVCTTRKKYRRGKKDTAVKVYTISHESRYLLVSNVPSYGSADDLIKMFALYGAVEEYRLLDDVPCEKFTDVYWIKFVSIGCARIAKRKTDDFSFLGQPLRVRYAPEYETVSETREKLEERRRTVCSKLYGHKRDSRAPSEQTSSSSSSSVPVPPWEQTDNEHSSEQFIPPPPPGDPPPPGVDDFIMPAPGPQLPPSRLGPQSDRPQKKLYVTPSPNALKRHLSSETIDYFPRAGLNDTVSSIRAKLRKVDSHRSAVMPVFPTEDAADKKDGLPSSKDGTTGKNAPSKPVGKSLDSRQNRKRI